MEMPIQITIKKLEEITKSALKSKSVSEAQAAAITDSIVQAERDSCPSHGFFRLPGYLKSVISGKVDAKAEPSVVQIAPSVIRVDAKKGFAPLAHLIARDPAIRLARSQGICAVAIVNSHHFSALWSELEPIAEQGIAGFAFRAGLSRVAAAGGKKPIFGTNPLGFAWPREGRRPLVIDFATSAIARGEIQLMKKNGRKIPLGWAVDSEGLPTDDPAIGLAGAQLTFGGYKGSALALMIELLAGPLIGDLLSFEALSKDNGDGGPPCGGELLILLDPSKFSLNGGMGSLEHSEKLFSLLTSEPGVRLPSDRRYSGRKKALESGVSISSTTLLEVADLVDGEVANLIQSLLGNVKPSVEGEAKK